MSSSSYAFKQLFFFCVFTPVVLPLNVDSVLFHESLTIVPDHWISASRGVHCIWFYQCISLCVQCSPGSAPFILYQFLEGYSSSHRIPPVYYSFENNNIPSPECTTTCSAIPQLKGIPLFSSFVLFFTTTKSTAKNMFAQVFFPLISLGVQTQQWYGWIKGQRSFSALCA